VKYFFSKTLGPKTLNLTNQTDDRTKRIKLYIKFKYTILGLDKLNVN